MPHGPVVPNISPIGDRCYIHHDRPTERIFNGQPMCSACARKSSEAFYGGNGLSFVTVRDLEELKSLLKEEAAQRQHAVEESTIGRPPDFEKCQLAWQYNNDLVRLRHASAGGKVYEEQEWRRKLPNLPIWSGIDDSKALRRRIREDFFSRSLSHCRRQDRFEFIGQIMNASSDQAYRWYKTYRSYTGMKQHRQTSNSSHRHRRQRAGRKALK